MAKPSPEQLDPPSPRRLQLEEPLHLACGKSLEGVELVYETYGRLNEQRSNAVLICHALSGDHHIAGFYAGDKRPGWWNEYVGPGKAIDTNLFFVVGVNNLGGCSGSTGPKTLRPGENRPWGGDFPPVRVRDWVACQRQLMLRLGVERWAAVVGGSLGGMQALRWAHDYPDQLAHAVVIAAALRLNAQNLAFNALARDAILNDPDYCGGHFLERGVAPLRGLALARMIAHVTYLSGQLMGDRFGRELRSGSFALGRSEDITFQVESYLKHQGSHFVENFDANTYLLMLRALDFFDLTRDYGGDAVQALARVACRFLVISFSSDWRFAPERSREIVFALVAAGKSVSYAEIDAPQGHDSFLVPNARYNEALGTYMRRVAEEA